MATLKSQLQKAAPALTKAAKKLQQRAIAELYADFCKHLKDVTVTDPTGRTIVFRIENFPYLIKMQYFNKVAGTWVSASAGVTIAALANGTLDETLHQYDPARAKGMLRIRDILEKPDSIHENVHTRVRGDIVYVVRLGGGNIKVAFIKKDIQKGEWVLVTSFFTTDRYVSTCAKHPPLYQK
jgi:hypothetical protein